MSDPEGNSWFCFPDSPDVSSRETSGLVSRGTWHYTFRAQPKPPCCAGQRFRKPHTARGFSVLYHEFARKQGILCAILRRKSYLTLLYVTSTRDLFCLGTFAHGFIRLPPSSLLSSWGFSLAVTLRAEVLLLHSFWSLWSPSHGLSVAWTTLLVG